MKATEIKETIRQMLADWDALTEQAREDALFDVYAEFVDRRKRYHGEPVR